MGSKRSFADVDSQDLQPGDAERSGSSFKRRKPAVHGKHKANEGSSEYAKKRARTIERLFIRGTDLPADVRNDLERELAAHKTTIADNAFQKRRSAMIGKYHMVRFFDRRKAMRLVKQLRRKIDQASDPAEVETLKRELHVAEVDEAYTLFHPHAEPYISLYKSPKANDAVEEDAGQSSIAMAALKSNRPPMWSVVEKTMEEGPGALALLRERRSPDGSSQAPKPKPAPSSASQKPPTDKRDEVSKEKPRQSQPEPPAAPAANGNKPLNRRERRRLMRETMAKANESEDDGEGGFFEGM